jgi:hypothetical protein
MTKVYCFTRYDTSTVREVRSKRMATREAIARVGGFIEEETELEVVPSAINSDGFYDPGEN